MNNPELKDEVIAKIVEIYELLRAGKFERVHEIETGKRVSPEAYKSLISNYAPQMGPLGEDPSRCFDVIAIEGSEPPRLSIYVPILAGNSELTDLQLRLEMRLKTCGPPTVEVVAFLVP
ncbi:MAG: hypothetical protein KTR21_05570 [Rhodobacteraceae bacterium]|nr:hypothetical protein [Paracoccaceae bacterium]